MNYITYILNYGVISPNKIVQQIINTTSRPVWAVWKPYNDTQYRLECFNPFQGEDLRAEDISWLDLILKHYFAERA